MKNPAAVALGRLGGQSTSPAKAAAARRNGLKNKANAGRPPAQYGTCPKCRRTISILKAGGFRKHNCIEKGEDNA